MIEQSVTVIHPVGLHARPAAVFVQRAQAFSSKVTVSSNNRSANAKSLLGLLTLGVTKGTKILIAAEGTDEKAAIAALVELVNTNFGE
jgi:phosphocarrier protein